MKGTQATLLALLAIIAAAVAVPTPKLRNSEPGGALGEQECKKATADVWHLPYPGDCTKFIKCDTLGGLSTIYTCDSPLHFSPVIQTCDWAWNAGCEGGDDSSGGTSAVEPPSIDSSGGSSDVDPSSSDSSSDGDGGCGATKEDSSSSESKPCDKSSSSSSSGSSSSSSSSHSHSSSSSSSSSHSHSSSSGHSHSSSSGSSSSSSSSSSESKDCGGDSSSTSEEKNPGGNENDICKDATPHRYHLPHPTDPTKFYKCELTTGIAHLFDCPAGLVFHPDIQVCSWP